jgi:NADH:ubiquinone oxidoreductase subunit 4 (subunit M)
LDWGLTATFRDINGDGAPDLIFDLASGYETTTAFSGDEEIRAGPPTGLGDHGGAPWHRNLRAIFYAVGHISQIKGTQRINRIRGLTVTHPALGWGFVVGVVAIAGLPPLGIFMSEFLVVSSTFARQPLLAIALVFGLLLAFGALTLRLTSVAFGEPRGSKASAEASYVPMFAHLALVLIAGVYLPAPLVAWFQHVARLLG